MVRHACGVSFFITGTDMRRGQDVDRAALDSIAAGRRGGYGGVFQGWSPAGLGYKSGMKEQNPYSPGDFCEVQGPVARRCGCSINLMRYFSLFVALLALLAGIGSVSVISKISQICLKTGGVADFPVLTQWMFRSSGWIPGGLFLAVAVAIICLVFARRVRTSFFLSVAALIFLVCSAVILAECRM